MAEKNFAEKTAIRRKKTVRGNSSYARANRYQLGTGEATNVAEGGELPWQEGGGYKSALAIVLHCLSCGLKWLALAQTDILSYVRHSIH